MKRIEVEYFLNTAVRITYKSKIGTTDVNCGIINEVKNGFTYIRLFGNTHKKEVFIHKIRNTNIISIEEL